MKNINEKLLTLLTIGAEYLSTNMDNEDYKSMVIHSPVVNDDLMDINSVLEDIMYDETSDEVVLYYVSHEPVNIPASQMNPVTINCILNQIVLKQVLEGVTEV